MWVKEECWGVTLLDAWFTDWKQINLGLIALAHVLVAVFLGWLAGRVWVMILGRITEKAGKELDHRLVAISRKPIAVLAFVLFLQVAREKLSQFPQWTGSPVFDWMAQLSFLVAVVAAALWVNAVLSTMIDWYLRNMSRESRSPLDEVFLPIVRKLLGVVTLFVALTMALSYFGIEITALIATAGVASLAVALAAQDTLSNMLSGFMILSDRPFKEGGPD
ncbi:MAG: mechanosensitive ion channel [Candidatus Desulforudis sp.]|nr:mechanosensitive ion channel [Desulforudis sp.]